MSPIGDVVMVEPLDPVYAYIDGKIEELKADLLGTKRAQARSQATFATVVIINALKARDMNLALKLRSKIEGDLKLVFDKISKSDNPLKLADEYMEQLNNYLAR
jgi:hypothetical protein